jgi:hypothetical protein
MALTAHLASRRFAHWGNYANAMAASQGGRACHPLRHEFRAGAALALTLVALLPEEA